MFFGRNLTKHKKEAATRMWEFGVPDFSYGEMIPAKEIFPNHSGGFVTTDMSNISSNPLIIQTIYSEIKKVTFAHHIFAIRVYLDSIFLMISSMLCQLFMDIGHLSCLIIGSVVLKH